MRFLFLILFAVTTLSYSQNDKVYRFTKSISIQEYDISKGSPDEDKKEIAQKGWLFKIDQDLDSGYVIRFLKWKKNEIRNKNFYSNTIMANKNGKEVKVDEAPKYFFISDSQFTDAISEYIGKAPWLSFVTGAITVPIKIRPSGEEMDAEGNKLRPFDFTGDINIGVSVGARIRLHPNGRSFVIPSAGINITSISVDPSTVKNEIITSKTNASSLTPFIGTTFEYDNFQASFLVGWDKLAGRTGENWIYQGKPWLGIGLGYNIFNTSNNTPRNQGNP